MEINLLVEQIGNVSNICKAMGMPRATYYRQLNPAEPIPKRGRKSRKSHRSLAPSEVQQITDVLHELRFVDKAPAEIYATLLDEGVYLCSISTMYRILRGLKEVQERRNMLSHPGSVAKFD